MLGLVAVGCPDGLLFVLGLVAVGCPDGLLVVEGRVTVPEDLPDEDDLLVVEDGRTASFCGLLEEEPRLYDLVEADLEEDLDEEVDEDLEELEELELLLLD